MNRKTEEVTKGIYALLKRMNEVLTTHDLCVGEPYYVAATKELTRLYKLQTTEFTDPDRIGNKGDNNDTGTIGSKSEVEG